MSSHTIASCIALFGTLPLIGLTNGQDAKERVPEILNSTPEQFGAGFEINRCSVRSILPIEYSVAEVYYKVSWSNTFRMHYPGVMSKTSTPRKFLSISTLPKLLPHQATTIQQHHHYRHQPHSIFVAQPRSSSQTSRPITSVRRAVPCYTSSRTFDPNCTLAQPRRPWLPSSAFASGQSPAKSLQRRRQASPAPPLWVGHRRHQETHVLARQRHSLSLGIMKTDFHY